MPEGKFVELVDKNDKVIGKVLRVGIHHRKELHRAVHVWIFNREGKLFLQKRPLAMQMWPGFWDSSCGEHVELGESYEQTALRGVKEELNLSGLEFEMLAKRIIHDKNAHEMLVLFRTSFDGKIEINRKELAGGKFFTFKEIQKLVKAKKTTPFFNEFFRWYIDERKNTENIT